MKSLLVAVILFVTIGAVSAQENWHVYVFIAEECPICNYMGKPLSALAKKYAGQVRFHAVFPTKNSNYKTSQQFKQQYDMASFETLLDKDHGFVKKFGVSVTPEAVITNEQGDVVYKGRINSAYYAPGKMKHSTIKADLDDALASLIAGKKILQPWPSAIGCYITTYASR